MIIQSFQQLLSANRIYRRTKVIPWIWLLWSASMSNQQFNSNFQKKVSNFEKRWYNFWSPYAGWQIPVVSSGFSTTFVEKTRPPKSRIGGKILCRNGGPDRANGPRNIKKMKVHHVWRLTVRDRSNLSTVSMNDVSDVASLITFILTPAELSPWARDSC